MSEQVSVQSDVMCNLTKHQATNSVRKSYKCLESKKTFTSKLERIVVHQRTHNQKKDHVCIECEKPFNTYKRGRTLVWFGASNRGVEEERGLLHEF